MRWGFHLSSLPDHDWQSIALPLLNMGYRGVTIRANADWFCDDERVSKLLSERLLHLRSIGLEVTLDADGRFLVDPWHAAVPRLARPEESSARETLLHQLLDIAGRTDCSLITFSVGDASSDELAEETIKRLAEAIARLIEHAERVGVTMAIKPVIGSAIETASHFHRLREWLPRSMLDTHALGWAADIGVMARRGELPIGDRLARDRETLACVYLSDIGAGEYGDCRFGCGELAVSRIVRSLEEWGYRAPLVLRCEGHSLAGLEIAKEAMNVVHDRDRSWG